MSRIQNRATAAVTFISFCIGMCFLLVSGCSQTDNIAVAVVSEPKGQVELREGAASQFAQAKAQAPIYAGGAVRTGEDGSTALDYADGSKILVHALSFFEIGNEAGKARQDKGSVLYQLQKQKKDVTIETPHGVTAVLGTTFLVQVDQDSTTVMVEEGKVEFRSKTGPEKQVIDAGYMLKVGGDGKLGQPVGLNPFEREQLFNPGKTKNPAINQQ